MISPQITEKFKAAGRLVNEWRDTIYYTAAVAAEVINCFTPLGIHHGGRLLLDMGFAREVLRGASWRNENLLYSRMGYCSAMLFMLARDVMPMLSFAPVNIEHLALTGVLLAYDYSFLKDMGSGLSAIPPAYEELLFDYPRKIKPPGHTQTRKAVNWFGDCWASIKDRLRDLGGAPSPAYQTARLPKAGKPAANRL